MVRGQAVIVKYVETVAWIFFGTIGAALLVLLPAFDNTSFWRVAFDAGHAPLFAFFALVILRLSHLWIGDRIREVHHYIIAFMLSMLGGALTEAAQVVLPRDASVMDLVRDGVGTLGGLAVHWAIYGKRWMPVRWTLAIVALALVGVTFVPLASSISAYRDRAAAFPKLVVFSPDLAERFIDVAGADVEYVKGGANITFRGGGERFPRLEIVEVESNWLGYNELAFTVTNFEDRTVQLHIRVNDKEHRNSYSDRFNRELEIEPGKHDIAIAIRDIQDAPAKRTMDLKAMRNVNFFLFDPKEDTRMRIENVRLQGDR